LIKLIKPSPFISIIIVVVMLFQPITKRYYEHKQDTDMVLLIPMLLSSLLLSDGKANYLIFPIFIGIIVFAIVNVFISITDAWTTISFCESNKIIEEPKQEGTSIGDDNRVIKTKREFRKQLDNEPFTLKYSKKSKQYTVQFL